MSECRGVNFSIFIVLLKRNLEVTQVLSFPPIDIYVDTRRDPLYFDRLSESRSLFGMLNMVPNHQNSNSLHDLASEGVRF